LAARYGGEPLSIQVRKRSTSSAGRGREQVLAHDPVLELRGLGEHVDQRLAVLDHERRLWDRSLDLINVRYRVAPTLHARRHQGRSIGARLISRCAYSAFAAASSSVAKVSIDRAAVVA
jgi:hypothetical protein